MSGDAACDNPATPRENASELATSVAALVGSRGFPEDAARDLLRVVGHKLAIDTTAELRQARLGLLIELVSDEGEFILSTAYETERRKRAARGEAWPTASTLTRLYGHWLTAVRAACRFWFGGGGARVAASHHHAKGEQAGYRPPQIIGALVACKRQLELPEDQWPTKWEYEEWSHIRRRLQRLGGQPAHAPGLKQIRKAFGSYESAKKACERHLGAAH